MRLDYVRLAIFIFFHTTLRQHFDNTSTKLRQHSTTLRQHFDNTSTTLRRVVTPTTGVTDDGNQSVWTIMIKSVTKSI